MSGISSSVGAISGINTGQLIDQLLSIEARPRTSAQNRIKTLQTSQAAYLDLNTRLATLRSAAQAFSINRVFDSANATSSNGDVLSGAATAGAASGVYQFVVDRLVSTQQILSRGFVDSNTTAIGASQFIVESARGRIDSDTSLSVLNGGNGIARGRILVTDSSGASATVDLSRVETVGDVLSTINGTTGIHVNARVDGDHLVVTDSAGGTGTLTIANASGYTTAASLGIAGTASAPGSAGSITGTQVNRVGGATTLNALNDGLGVSIRGTISVTETPDFAITSRDGTVINVDIGNIYSDNNGAPVLSQPAVTDLQGVIDRINNATGNGGRVVASINSAGTGLQITDTTAGVGTLSVAEVETGRAAADLGILGSAAGATLSGTRLIAGLNSTLVSNLNGGRGLTDATFTVKDRTGTTHNFSFGVPGSVTDLISQFNTQTGGAVTLELDATGTGLIARDRTAGGGTLTIGGAGATELGVAASGDTDGVVQSARLQHRWISSNTRVETLNNGRGIGTGTFEIVNSLSARYSINIDSSIATVNDLVGKINSVAQGVRARVNDNGDGIVVEEFGVSGGAAITIRDTSNTVAKNLNIAGTATGTGAANRLDGSNEKVLTFLPADTLAQVITKINDANAGISASLVNDGSPGRPYRLQITSRSSGLGGAFTLDSGGLDLGFTTLSQAQNARVLYGSGDPAQALLFSSSTNTITGVIGNVTLTAKSVNANPVTITIDRDGEAIEKAVNDFAKAFNDLTNKIDSQSTYDVASNKRGTLLGDTVAQTLRASLYATITGGPKNVSGRYQNFAQVGLTVGRDGQLSVNLDKLRQSIATDPQAVEDLFAAKTAASTVASQQVLDTNGNAIPGVTVTNTAAAGFTSQGIGELLGALADSYIASVTGTLTRATKTLDDQIQAQNKMITNINTRLEARRTYYQNKFAAMETALAKLQGQSSALTSLSSMSLG
ncbi:MAG: flagellar filament capping protein FliD [Phycisphaerales bacterium]